MEINLMEQRELADYIGKRIGHPGLSDDIWFAIEDYIGTAENGPDVLALAKARIEDDQASDPDDFRDNYFTRDR